MNIPNTFKLFQQTWCVRTGTEKELPNELGMCYVDTNEILLRTQGLPVDKIIHVFLHEVIHAIEQSLELEMSERQVDLMALGVMDLFRSNPNMLELLLPLEDTTWDAE